MKRSKKSGGQSVKARRRKAAGRMRPVVAKARRRGGDVDAGLRRQLEEKTRELNEALEQQAATADVLRVISSSPGELEPVFQAMLENATRICDAKIGILFRYQDGAYTAVSLLGVTPVYAEYLNRGPIRAGPATGLGRVASTKQTVHIADTQAEQAYADRDPFRVATAELGGARSLLNVPMLKDGELIGAIGIYRQEVRPFTDKQIALVTNFAAQAVIAIENTRLLNELRQRTDDLTELLEQQTATADVLRVISSSPGELEPVFQAMLANAARICEAKFGLLFRFDGDKYESTAGIGTPPALAEFLRQRGPFISAPNTQLHHVMRTKRASHTADYAADAPDSAPVRLGGARSTVDVPMLKEGMLVGAISIYRQEVRPFTDKQITLLQNFAAQAVIAIENTRLLNELRQSLEQQTATADVLRVISSSPGELEPVFNTMLENAVRICDAKFGTLYRIDNGAFDAVALFGAPPALVEFWRQHGSYRPPAGTALDRLLRTEDVVRVSYQSEEPDAAMGPSAMFGGGRSFVVVPMLKENALIGAITIYRQEVRPFADKQVELLKNFAAQAVIAIENTRLLNELRESLENQTASADILRAIASSPESAERALDVIAETTARRFGADNVNIRLLEGQMLRYVGSTGPMAAHLRELFPEGPLDPDLISGKAILERRQIYIHADDGEYGLAPGVMSNVATPLMREGQAIGAFMVTRSDPRPFSERDLAQLSNFAAQAVIAIENTRLLNELRQSLEQQTATADVLRIISSSPGELEPVFNAMLENATRICQAQFGMLNLYDGSVFRNVALHNPPPQFAKRLGEIIKPHPDSGLAQVVRTGQIAHIEDLRTGQPYLDGDKAVVDVADLGGARTVLIVPMLSEGKLIGAISIYRQEVRPFTDKQIALVQNFAAQAVIAIENTRLLNELRTRTTDLAELLERQTATSEVLRVISSSPGELEPVFQAMLANAVRICDAKFGMLYRYDNEAFDPVALFGVPPAHAEFLQRRGSFQPPAGTGLDRLVRTKDVVRIADDSGVAVRQQCGKAWRRAVAYRRANAQRECIDWRHRHLPSGGPSLHRQANRVRAEFRRPGRHRHREHAVAQRIAPAHNGPYRIAGAADRDIGSSQGHLEFARRAGARVQRGAGKCHAHLRSPGRQSVSPGRRRLSCGRGAWRVQLRRLVQTGSSGRYAD